MQHFSTNVENAVGVFEFLSSERTRSFEIVVVAETGFVVVGISLFFDLSLIYRSLCFATNERLFFEGTTMRRLVDAY